VVAWAAISREITVAPSGEFEFSQIYLYDEAITDLDAFIEAVADEKANGAELVDVELTALRTGALSSEPVMVLTFRHDLAGQRVEEAAAMHTLPPFLCRRSRVRGRCRGRNRRCSRPPSPSRPGWGRCRRWRKLLALDRGSGRTVPRRV
jgi:hypothetical protein